MAEVCEDITETPDDAPARPPQGISPARLAALDGAATRLHRPLRPVEPSTAAPQLRCGWCQELVPDTGNGRYVRCEACGHTLHIPSHVSAQCVRCNRQQRIRIGELRAERLCAVCGKSLELGDVVLPPRRHQHTHAAHRSHRRHRPGTPGGHHGDAAWAVLIIGLTLVICVLSLTVL